MLASCEEGSVTAGRIILGRNLGAERGSGRMGGLTGEAWGEDLVCGIGVRISRLFKRSSFKMFAHTSLNPSMSSLFLSVK